MLTPLVIGLAIATLVSCRFVAPRPILVDDPDSPDGATPADSELAESVLAEALPRAVANQPQQGMADS